jgi:hypothetical protein
MSNIINFPYTRRLLMPGRKTDKLPAVILELDLYRHRKTPLRPTPRRKISKSASA